MKKNILAIAILAATIANIALSAIMILIIVPESKQTTTLITKILSCIDLELENPNAADYGKVPLSDREEVKLCEKMTVNLASAPGETKGRFAQVNCTLILNKKSADYGAVTAALSSQGQYLSAKLDKLVAVYTASTIKAAEDAIASQMLDEIKAYVDSPDCVIDIVVTTLTQ